jgi:hypothetical protein
MFCNTPEFSARGSKSDTQTTARFRREDNIKTYLQGTNYEGVEWIQLDQDTD